MYNQAAQNSFDILNVNRIHANRNNAIQNGLVWDLSSEGCSMPDQKVTGNLLFLLQRKTQNFVRNYIRSEDINDTKLNNIINSKIQDQSNLLQLLRLSKIGLRELANEADAFDYDNVLEYVEENGIPMFEFMTGNQLAEVVTMNNQNFLNIVKQQNCIPFVYYALIKYSLKIMLQRHIEFSGECQMA